MTPTIYGLQMFREVWDLLGILWLMSSLAFVSGVLATWLARMEDAAHLLDPTRPSLAFDWYRAIALIGFWWFTIGAVTAIEPYIWMFVAVTPEGTLLASSAWTMLALGFQFGMGCFCVFRVQEWMGWHAWQRPEPAPNGWKMMGVS